MDATVIISNLPVSIDSLDLEDMCSIIGTVRSAIVVQDQRSNVGKQLGTVSMATREDAENCVLYFNRQTMDGSKLFAALKVPPPRKPKSTLRARPKL